MGNNTVNCNILDDFTQEPLNRNYICSLRIKDNHFFYLKKINLGKKLQL